MAESGSFLQRLLQAVQHEYERRLRRASTHDAAHAGRHAHPPETEDRPAQGPSFPTPHDPPRPSATDEPESAEISNIPLGTPLHRRRKDQLHSPDSQ